MSKKDNPDKVDLMLLRTINNNYELDMIKSLLDDNDIPYIVKDHGAGGYMRIISGSSFNRTDILVEESTYDEAKELLDQLLIE